MDLYLIKFDYPSEQSEIDFLRKEHKPGMMPEEEWDFYRVVSHKESLYPLILNLSLLLILLSLHRYPVQRYTVFRIAMW